MSYIKIKKIHYIKQSQILLIWSKTSQKNLKIILWFSPTCFSASEFLSDSNTERWAIQRLCFPFSKHPLSSSFQLLKLLDSQKDYVYMMDTVIISLCGLANFEFSWILLASIYILISITSWNNIFYRLILCSF